MFTDFKKAIQNHFAQMSEIADHVYEVEVDKDELWNLYLDSFPAGTNEIYRERREYDCSCCRQFIRAIGNVVFIKDAVVHTIWELTDLGTTFQPVADALDVYIKAHAVTDVYISKFAKIGTDKNHSQYGNRVYDMGFRKDNVTGEWIRIITFPTKHHWRDKSDLELIKTSAEQLIDICEGRGIATCYLTQPGCANGGLDWDSQVKPLIERILDDRFVIADYQL